MWGRSVLGSEILSTSKKRLPGMRLALNSCLGSLPAVHSKGDAVKRTVAG